MLMSTICELYESGSSQKAQIYPPIELKLKRGWANPTCTCTRTCTCIYMLSVYTLKLCGWADVTTSTAMCISYIRSYFVYNCLFVNNLASRF